MKVGDIYKTNKDGNILILEKLGNGRYLVQFELSGNTRETNYDGIKKGCVADKVARVARQAAESAEKKRSRDERRAKTRQSEIDRKIKRGIAKATADQARDEAKHLKEQNRLAAAAEKVRIRAEKEAAKLARKANRVQADKDTADAIAEFVGSYSKVLLNDFLYEGKYAKSIITSKGQRYTRSYATWASITQRCKVGGSFQKKFKHYVGTTICDEWQDDFQAFALWYRSQPGYSLGWDVDKDFMSSEKHYSPDTCILLPRILNLLLCGKQAKGTSLAYYSRIKCGRDQWRHKDGATFFNHGEAIQYVIQLKSAELVQLRAKYEPLGVPSAVFDKIQCDIDNLTSQAIS